MGVRNLQYGTTAAFRSFAAAAVFGAIQSNPTSSRKSWLRLEQRSSASFLFSVLGAWHGFASGLHFSGMSSPFSGFVVFLRFSFVFPIKLDTRSRENGGRARQVSQYSPSVGHDLNHRGATSVVLLGKARVHANSSSEACPQSVLRAFRSDS